MICAEPAGFAQNPGVSFIGLDAPVTGRVDGREVRGGGDHLMAGGFEAAGALISRFHRAIAPEEESLLHG
jgi:hypothetical protein